MFPWTYRRGYLLRILQRYMPTLVAGPLLDKEGPFAYSNAAWTLYDILPNVLQLK